MNDLVKYYLLFISLMTVPSAAKAATTPNPRDLMAAYEKASRLANVKASATLTNKEVDGTAKVKKFTYWRKLGPDGVHFRTLTHFHEPAEINGEQILFTEQAGDKADVLMYLPAYKKTRRVEKQSHRGSFMNSEFSYADIATPHLDDFDYKSKPDAPCADQSPCHVIEAIPKDDDVRERIGYSRTVYWLRVDSAMVSRAEHFDTAGKLRKVLIASETKEVDPVNHRYMSHRLEMENAVTKRRTEVRFSGVNIKDVIADAKFAAQNLGKD